MSIIDLIILSITGWGFYKGFHKGLFYIVLSVIGIIAGFFLASHFSGIFIPYLSRLLDWNNNSLLWLSYLIVFVLVLFIARLISYLLEKFFKWTGLGWLNRLAGGIFSAIKYLFIIGLLLTGIDEIQTKFKIFPENIFENTQIYRPLVDNTRKVIDWSNELRNQQNSNKKDEENISKHSGA